MTLLAQPLRRSKCFNHIDIFVGALYAQSTNTFFIVGPASHDSETKILHKIAQQCKRIQSINDTKFHSSRLRFGMKGVRS